MFRKYAFASALVFLCAMLAAATPARATDDDDEPARLLQPLGIAPDENLRVEATTSALPEVLPAQFNGDLRDLQHTTFTLPRYFHMWNEFEEPQGFQPPLKPGSSDDQPNNVSIASMPATTANFAGIGFDTVVTGGSAGAGWPPDTNGDVGPTVYIQSVNDAYAIYDKATGAQLAAFTEDSLWSGAATGTPCDNLNEGDPVVMHDAIADRWILTNFAFGFNASGNEIPPFYQCFAVSKTSNPVSGGWWLYAVKMDVGGAGLPPAGTLNDYGKFGLWNDGCLYMGANGFNSTTGAYVGAIFASFNTANMYAGAALTSSIGFISATSNPFSLFPANLLGTSAASMPAAGTPEYFINESNAALRFEVRKFTPGPSCGAGGAMSAATNVSQTSYTRPGQNIVPQPGTTNTLDSLGDRLMQKVQYRKIGSAESLWVVHSVRASASSTVRPQWAQIDVTGGTIGTTPLQQQIYAPDTTIYRWMGSVAVDQQGNMAIGYTSANGTSPNFPSLAYSGRLSTDPANNLSQGEAVLVAGGGSQINGIGSLSSTAIHRWGDYSAMSMDPADDCTFWYTNEYYDTQANGNISNWRTRIGSFKFPTCGAVVTHTVTPSVTGSGTITPNTPQTVNHGSTTAFTVAANANNHLVNVTGTCGGNLVGNTYTTNAVNADCTVIANFAIDTHTVTPSVTGSGTITPSTPQTVNHGATTAFTVAANANNHLVNVTGTCGGNLVGNTYTTNAVNADCTVIANYAIDTHTVTPSVTGNGSITPNTPQTVNHGATIAFTIAPNAGNHVVNVTGTCGGSLVGNTYTTNAIVADCTVIANFNSDTHTVTPSVTGNGTITPNTPQIVNDGLTTAFTVSANAGSHLVSVTGTCGGSLVGNVYTTNAVVTNCTVIANFAPDTTHTVTPSVTGNGSINPNTPQAVNDGATTAFTVTANANNHLVNVTGTCGGTLVGNTYTTNAITVDCTVIANFAVDTHIVTPSVIGNGSINPNTPQTVNHGATTAFTVTPNANNHLVNVTGTCGGSLAGNTYTTNAVNADCTVIANFAIDTHTVTPSVTGSGAINPNTPVTVNHGSTTAFTVTPNANNHLVNVTGTCGGTLVGNVYTTNAVSADCTVIANFAVDTHTVTPSVTGNGSINPNTPQTVSDGATTAFTLTPNANNHLVNVTGTCGGTLVGNTYTTNAITVDCTVIANFAVDTHTVTPSVTGSGAINPNTPQTVNHGATTAFTVTANANNHIVNVTGTCGGNLVGNTYTTNAITADCTVIANFAVDTHTVTPSVTGSGTITPNTPQTVNHGSTTAFTVAANANNHIVNVTGTCGGNLVGNTYTTNAVNADCTVIANFAVDTHTVTPSVTGNGSINPNTPQTVNHGATTAFTVTPNANNHIVNVTGTCGGTLVGNTYTTNAVNADCTVIANFAVDTHTVTPSVTGNGSINPNTPQTVNHGSTTAFTVTPNANNHIVNVTGTCGGTLVGSTYTTNAINADCTVIATFAVDTHTVTPSVTGNGSINPSTPQTVNHGSTTTLTVTPNANNHVVNVTGTCGGSLVGNIYTTNAVNADCTVIANFALNVLVFTTQPADVTRGNALATVVVTEQDGSGKTISDNATVAFTINACGGPMTLGSVAMSNGVATLNSAQHFYTLASGLTVAASTSSLNGTSATFNIVSGSDYVFADSYEACRP